VRNRVSGLGGARTRLPRAGPAALVSNGAVDGVWGAGSQSAVERLQQVRGLQPNGQLNPPTVTALGLAPDVLAYP
jgi:peptidoglycan hydrolase-like protein with peptidoglycan-binding domain